MLSHINISMKAKKGIFISGIALVTAVILFSAYRLSNQLGPEMEFSDNAFAQSPVGICYVQHPGSAFDQILIHMFYLGEEVDFDSAFSSNLEKQNQSRYYHVRNRNDFGVMIRKDSSAAPLGFRFASPVSILRASGFSAFCTDHAVPHNEIFKVLMSSVFHCSEADDIDYICLDEYSEKKGDKNQLLITERSMIDDIWSILNRGIFYHDLENCNDENNCKQPIDAADIKSYGTTNGNGKRVILFFPDGSNFFFSFYPERNVMLIENSDVLVAEYLYLSEKDNARLTELFGMIASMH